MSLDTNDNAVEKHVSQVVQRVVETTKEATQTVQLSDQDRVFFHKLSHLPIHLSEQQAVSLKLLAQGKRSKEIARDMNLSYRTVEGTLATTMELLWCISSKELIVLYHNKP